MARKPRAVSATGVYHFINRGVNRKKLFHRPKDYEYYLGLIHEYKTRFEMQIYHYCLMINHSHLLLKVEEIANLSRFAHFIQRRYAYYYCKSYKWNGQVFQNRYKSIPVEKDSYLLECGRYIERNPVRAKLVADPGDFSYSSYAHYAAGRENRLITPNPLYLEMGESDTERAAIYRGYAATQRPYEEILDGVLVPF